MSMESIRKIWVLIGSVIFAINADWIPEIVKGVFAPEGTELVFAAIGAVLALWQFVKSRTGEGGPSELNAEEKKVTIMYALNPFAKAA